LLAALLATWLSRPRSTQYVPESSRRISGEIRPLVRQKSENRKNPKKDVEQRRNTLTAGKLADTIFTAFCGKGIASLLIFTAFCRLTDYRCFGSLWCCVDDGKNARWRPVAIESLCSQ
jgi:hypothetical protein